MRLFFGGIALAAMCLTGIQDSAGAADTFSPALASFPSSHLAAGEIAIPSEPEPARYAADFNFEDEPAPAATQSYWPLLYSLLVPGMGELSMGYEKRGIFLMALEVVAWTGYYTNHNDGMDERDAYEAFADAHWDFDKWIDEHPSSCPATTLEQLEECGQASSGSGDWPGYIPYVSKEEDKQHYYENIGKYDWYISGWSDWDPADYDPLKDPPYATETDLRTEYRDMRAQSNESLDTANEFVWVSVAARAFSLVETAIIIHNRRADAAAGGGEGTPISLRARPRGYSGGEVALEVRFR
jgi:hypothetical protein